MRKFREIIGMIGYPKGAILHTTSEVYPGDYIGGTWIKIEDCFLAAVGQDNAVSCDYTNATNGGTKDAINVAHTHSAAASHNHSPSTGSKYGFIVYRADEGVAKRKTRPATGSSEMYVHTTPTGDSSVLGYIYSWAAYSGTVSAPSGAVSGTGKNIPLYKAVYIWLRTEW